MAAWYKHAAAMGSALPDPVKDQAALAPIPQQAIENKPAPGQTGPKGMSPRTTYSRVNTGSPPVMDAGAMSQKSGPNRGMEFLPAKLAAQRGFMTTMKERPLLHDLVKAAMSGTADKLSVNLEASRQAQAQQGVKTASVRSSQSSLNGHVSTEMATKLANALGFIEQQLLKEADLAPGEGPGSLQVLEATSSETNIDAGESGQATAKNQPPQTPSLQPEQVQQGNAGTGLETNDDMSHPEQPLEPIKNASALLNGNLSRMGVQAAVKEGSAMGKLMAARDGVKALSGKAKAVAGEAKDIFSGSRARAAVGEYRDANKALKVSDKLRVPEAISKHVKERASKAGPAALKEVGKTVGAYTGVGAVGAGGVALAKGKKKESSVPLALIRKLAEDAINPANVESGRGQDPMTPPEGASASEEGVPSEPSDVTGQKRLISSNQAAIDYTKGQAKADPKKDVNQVLTEPALSSATDKVLDRAFDSTSKAGVKISSAGGLRKTASSVAATRVILNRLLKTASETCAKDAAGKDKRSTGISTPQAATGASAATMGQ